MKSGGLRNNGLNKSNQGLDLISIITVVFNGEKHIRDTIESVLQQSYKNVEYIVVDGGSKDNTLSIIEAYNDKIDYWISEPDKGIADAFNKGIQLAKGEVVGLINADDYLLPDALATVMSAYDPAQPSIICGGMKILHPDRPDRIWYSSLEQLNKEMTIAHPATFVPKKYYDQMGTFDLSYKVAMDYELMLRMKYNGASFTTIKSLLSIMRGGGVSSRHYKTGLQEIVRAREKYISGHSSLNARLFVFLRLTQSNIMRILTKMGVAPIVTKYFKRKIFE